MYKQEIPFGELLVRFRKRQHLSQEALAVLLGTHRNTISLWERGDYLPDTLTMVLELIRVLSLSEDEANLLLEARFGTSSVLPVYALPYSRNPYFTGREDLLQSLHTNLTGADYGAPPIALSGLGGVGKTQLALEYAYRYRKSYRNIFWADAASFQTLFEAFVQFASLLHLLEKDKHDQRHIIAAVKQWLTEHKEWLLILDNLEQLDLIATFVPPKRRGAVLFTTRRFVTEPAAQAMIVESMSEEEGSLLLLRRAKRLLPSDTLENASLKDITLTCSLVRSLGGLPLALDQAGAYILETGSDLSNYQSLLQRRFADVLSRRGSVPSGHPASVMATFSLAFESVQNDAPLAYEILQLCAFLAPEAIPEEVISQGAIALTPTFEGMRSDEMAFDTAIEVLTTFSLLQRDWHTKTITLHRLVQAVLQQEMDEETSNTWLKYAIQAVNEVIPNGEHDSWLVLQRYLPQITACATHIKQKSMILPEGVHILLLGGTYLSEQAQYQEAKTLLQLAHSTQEHLQGASFTTTITILYQRAKLLYRQGKYPEAEELFQHALTLQEQSQQGEDILTVRLLNNMAELTLQQEKYDQAELFAPRALKLAESLAGSQHPDTAVCLETIALLHYRRAQYTQAEAVLRQALHIYEQTFGTDHPRFIAELNILAEIFRTQGKYFDAAEILHRVLTFNENHYGELFPDTALSHYVLAQLYFDQGKKEEAKKHCQQALKVCLQLFVPSHPATAQCLSLLAKLEQ